VFSFFQHRRTNVQIPHQILQVPASIRFFYKTYVLEFATDEFERKRLNCDARLTAMLQQRNTVSTYELGRDDPGNIYLTMSPEQLQQDPSIDHRTNIFSLDAVLNGILRGEKPAHGEKFHEIVETVLNQGQQTPLQWLNTKC
jgi:hypothetical protein